MIMKTIKRVYVDTSVFGGYFEPEFEHSSTRFFSCVNNGQFIVVLSPVTLLELAGAPLKVKELLANVPIEFQEILVGDDRVYELRDAYLKAGVVKSKSSRDAEHIAFASVNMADVIVSWNFKHIVHLDRIRGFHSVNLLHGYPLVPIHIPTEVLPYDERSEG